MKQLLKPVMLKMFDKMNQIYFSWWCKRHLGVITQHNQYVTSLPGERILILAPHVDDEIIGCGGALLHYLERDKTAGIVYLTDGRYGGRSKGYDPDTLVRLRREEAFRVAADIGLPDSHLFFLDGKDQELLHCGLTDQLSRIMAEFMPDTLFLPVALDTHPDHSAASVQLYELWRKHPSLLFDCQLYLYEVQSPITPLYSNLVLDITPYYHQKRALCRHYQSQAVDFSFLDTTNRVNALAFREQGAAYAEVYINVQAKQYMSFLDKHLSWEKMDGIRHHLVPCTNSRSIINSYRTSLTHKTLLADLAQEHT